MLPPYCLCENVPLYPHLAIGGVDQVQDFFWLCPFWYRGQRKISLSRTDICIDNVDSPFQKGILSSY